MLNIGIVLLVFAFFYAFRGYAVLLVLGAPALGVVMLANGANNQDLAVGLIFFVFCWFAWVYHRGFKSRRL
jgi:hypothetical protein